QNQRVEDSERMPRVKEQRRDPRDVDRDREQDGRSEDGLAAALQPEQRGLDALYQLAGEQHVGDQGRLKHPRDRALRGPLPEALGLSRCRGWSHGLIISLTVW